MTTINTQNSGQAVFDPTRTTTPTGNAGDFAGALRNYASAVETTTPLASPAIVNPLLLQDVAAQERLRRDRDAHDRGRKLLDGLAALRRAMLEAGDEQSEVARLGELLASIPQAHDPALACLVSAIAVRTTVELCRRERG